MCLLLDLLSYGPRPLVLNAHVGWGREEEVKEISWRVGSFKSLVLENLMLSPFWEWAIVGKGSRVSFQRVPLSSLPHPHRPPTLCRNSAIVYVVSWL